MILSRIYQSKLKENIFTANPTFLRALLVLFLTLVFQISMAQSLSDIQNLKVDNLTDAQIEQLITRARTEGISPTQIDALARERGMPATEALKLRNRINNLLSSSSASPTGSVNSFQGRSNAGGEEDFYLIRSAKVILITI